MDAKQGALYTILVLGGIGLLAVSCTDSEEESGEHALEKKVHEAPLAHQAEGSEHEQKEEHQQADTLHAAKEIHATHWGYSGEGAPYLWNGLKEEYELCGTGKSQSPIDISTVTITDLADIEFNYQESPLVISNNGHTIQVSYAPGSSITVAGKQYDLMQFHFHSPSEHTIGGKAYDMVAHLVHKAADGQLGVIGLMFKTGAANDHIAKLWTHMPQKAGMTSTMDDVMISAADLLPRDMTYFNYSGSLTTPPCSEGVSWIVLATPINVSSAQVEQFTELFPLSTRPVQPLNGRTVNLSN